MTAAPSHGYRAVLGPASRRRVETHALAWTVGVLACSWWEAGMPTAAAVGHIIYERGAVWKALAELMGRSARAEGHGIVPLP